MQIVRKETWGYYTNIRQSKLCQITVNKRKEGYYILIKELINQEDCCSVS